MVVHASILRLGSGLSTNGIFNYGFPNPFALSLSKGGVFPGETLELLGLYPVLCRRLLLYGAHR